MLQDIYIQNNSKILVNFNVRLINTQFKNRFRLKLMFVQDFLLILIMISSGFVYKDLIECHVSLLM